MKKLILLFVVLFIGFLIGYFYSPLKCLLLSESKTERKKTALVTYPILDDKSFVIFIFAHEDSGDYRRCLLSVLTQEYDNLKIFYIDESQAKGEEEGVRAFLSLHDPFQRVRYIQSESEQDSFERFYQIMHGRPPSEVALVLKTSDFLSEKDVLNRLNSAYANSDIWMTFARCAESPSYRLMENDKKRFLTQFKRAEFLDTRAFLSSTMYSFYVGLFHSIKLQDFLDEGTFFSKLEHLVFMTPILELGKHHAIEMNEVHLVKKVPSLKENAPEKISEHLNTLPTYPPLLTPPNHNILGQLELIDLVVFSQNSPLELYAFLESVEKSVSHVHHLSVIYFSASEHYEKEYRTVKSAFPSVTFFKQAAFDIEDFSLLVKKVLFDRYLSDARYVLLALDHIIIKEKVDLQQAAQCLKKTGAYAFFFHLAGQEESLLEQVAHTISIDEEVLAWQFSPEKGRYCLPHLIDLTLYNKEEIYPSFQGMNFNHINALKTLWGNGLDLEKLGLFYARPKSIAIPLKAFTQQSDQQKESSALKARNHLLHLFNQGFKIDIGVLKSSGKESASIDDQPTLIERQ